MRYYGKDVNRKVTPASTVKVMTALLALERLPLNQKIKVSYRATLPQPSKLDVKSGEQYTVENLLYAILLKSANDAAVVLAEGVAGSEAKFVQLMNERARELGAKNTHFVNPNGLPSAKEQQYTTAYDMYLIFREAAKHPFFRNALTLKYKTIQSTAGREIKLKSHNKMLFMGWKSNVWGKTGWTRHAGACFVGYIPRGKDQDMCIIALFGATDRWNDIKYIIEHYGGIDL